MTETHQDGQRMLDLFASVGATHFDVTWTTCAGGKELFRRNVALAELQNQMPAMLDHAPMKQRNIIVRPHGANVTFIQLDDLKVDKLPALAPAMFLSLETSPGNFQAWVALASMPDKDFARRLRKGAGADPTASGATRVAGSLNFKEKYAPNFPRVTICGANSGKLITTETLERLGLVAAPELVAQPLRIPAVRISGGVNRAWPNYERCLEGAPPSQSSPGQPRQSIADFTWCLIAASWGWPIKDVAERLLEESAKARENGRAYALQTATRAADASRRNAERRRHQPPRQRL